MDKQDEVLEWLQHETEPRTIMEIQVGIESPSSAQVYHDVYMLMHAQQIKQIRLENRRVGYEAVLCD